MINKVKIINIDKDVKILRFLSRTKVARKDGKQFFILSISLSHFIHSFSLSNVAQTRGEKKMKNWNFHTSFFSIQRDEAFIKGRSRSGNSWHLIKRNTLRYTTDEHCPTLEGIQVASFWRLLSSIAGGGGKCIAMCSISKTEFSSFSQR